MSTRSGTSRSASSKGGNDYDEDAFSVFPEARETVEPFLRARSLDMALRYGPRSLEFEFERGEVIDRKPTPGARTLVAETGHFTCRFGKPGGTVGLLAFPPPPAGMIFDPAASLMFDRYQLYREGGTTLADAANFCLTVLEKDAGTRAAAAQKLSVAKNVLSQVAKLTATKGGAMARKADGSKVDFTGHERQWLEEVMTVVIRRAAEVAFDPAATRPQITMKDLPSLT